MTDRPRCHRINSDGFVSRFPVYRRDRTVAHVRTRQLCWTIVSRLTALDSVAIGGLFDRDPSTVRDGIARIMSEPFPVERRDLEAHALAAIGRVQRRLREASL